MTDDFINSIRLTPQQRSELLRSMEQSTSAVKETRRQHERIDCRFSNVPFVVTHPDGQVARFLIATRNISAGGLAFLHGGFLYPGSGCEITLPTVWGGIETLTGSIITCRHVDKHVHEFSMRFAALIDTRRFVTLPGAQMLESEPERSDASSLTGRVLIVDENVVNVDLARHQLKGSSVEILAATTIEEGIVVMRSSPIDAILLDLDCAERTPGELVLEYRDAGYQGPIIGATSAPDSELSQAALAAGADEVLARPTPASGLVRALTKCRSGAACASDPVRSELPCSPDTVELISNYLCFIETLTETLAEGVEKDDLEQLIKGCKGIAQSAGGYGFPTLEQAAKTAEQALLDSSSVSESSQELQRLQRVCARLEPMKAD